MDEFIKGVLTAPLATLLIVAGILFLFVAVVGNISGKIEPGVKGRIASGVLGFAFVLIGLTMHFTQEAPRIPATQPEHSKLNQATKLPQTPAAREIEVPRESIDSTPSAGDREKEVHSESIGSVSSTADKEPNDHIRAANLITEGTIIRGSIATKQDRDFYRFNAPSSATRVILRKLSLPGFGATIDIYDAVEHKIAYETEFGDQPVTISFESIAGAIYYIVVKSYKYKYRGDYELEGNIRVAS